MDLSSHLLWVPLRGATLRCEGSRSGSDFFFHEYKYGESPTWHPLKLKCIGEGPRRWVGRPFQSN